MSQMTALYIHETYQNSDDILRFFGVERCERENNASVDRCFDGPHAVAVVGQRVWRHTARRTSLDKSALGRCGWEIVSSKVIYLPGTYAHTRAWISTNCP